MPPKPSPLRSRRKLAEAYLSAKESVIACGFAHEVDWQDGVRFSDLTETGFLREAAWVVLSSGMAESVIRAKFGSISDVFLQWQSASAIVAQASKCRAAALRVFGHMAKIDAIITIAKRVFGTGFQAFAATVVKEGVEFLRTLPYMGPATSYHLAKNIGLDVVKPDRHLTRVAVAAGYESPRLLCEQISQIIGDRVAVVDLVIWRFATLNPRYAEYFA